jgi:hypothetical protein
LEAVVVEDISNLVAVVVYAVRNVGALVVEDITDLLAVVVEAVQSW